MDDTPARVNRDDDRSAPSTAGVPRPDPEQPRGYAAERRPETEKTRGYVADPQPEIDRTRGYAAGPGVVPPGAVERRAGVASARRRAADRDASADADDRTRQIREEIEQTRDDMSETIDALQAKLQPRNLVNDAKARMRHAAATRMRSMAHTAGDTASEMMDQTRSAADAVGEEVRHNPIPAALIGIGAAWLFWNRSQSDGRRGRRSRWSDSRYRGARPEWTGYAYAAEVDYDYDYGGDESRARRFGSEAADSARSMASRVRDTSEELGSRAQESWEEARQRVRYRGRRAGNQLQRLMYRNPLMAGAGAFVLGAAVGLLIPETETENEWLGEARDGMLERAQDQGKRLAENAATRVREAASDTVGKLTEEVMGTGSSGDRSSS